MFSVVCLPIFNTSKDKYYIPLHRHAPMYSTDTDSTCALASLLIIAQTQTKSQKIPFPQSDITQYHNHVHVPQPQLLIADYCVETNKPTN